ncbi:MAG: ferredoxin family protein [Pirellulaceae bacterium]
MITTATPDVSTTTLVVSRGQSRNPKKRDLEQAIIDAAEKMEGVDVVVVPHLYDLPKSSESYQRLTEIQGDIVLVSWIYSRAAHWVLDRNGVQGQYGEVQMGEDDEEELGTPEVAEQSPTDEAASDKDPVERVIDLYPRPDRMIHCLDLKITDKADPYVAEIRRVVGLPSNELVSLPVIGGKIVQVDEATSRRWYPVIDFSRCTNCMECVDFCLFGVYGVDGAENILVEQPDNCRKGCPACSRVCPENAIIFPQHKAPAIAGAQVDGEEGFKIDLSLLFGAPTGSDDPIATAARERDEQLLLTGRDAVGIDDQLKRRQEDLAAKPKDRLDKLLDSLDEFDL